MTLWIHAVLASQFQLADYLVEKGANVNITFLPKDEACCSNNYPILLQY